MVPGELSCVFVVDDHVPDSARPVVVRGTILLHFSCASVLVDTGSSLSVISYSFVYNLGLNPVDFGKFLSFETVTATHTTPKRLCYQCSLVIHDKFFEWNLFALRDVWV